MSDDWRYEQMRLRAKREIAAQYRIYYLGAWDLDEARRAKATIGGLRYVLGDEWFTWLYRWQAARKVAA